MYFRHIEFRRMLCGIRFTQMSVLSLAWKLFSTLRNMGIFSLRTKKYEGIHTIETRNISRTYWRDASRNEQVQIPTYYLS